MYRMFVCINFKNKWNGNIIEQRMKNFLEPFYFVAFGAARGRVCVRDSVDERIYFL